MLLIDPRQFQQPQDAAALSDASSALPAPAAFWNFNSLAATDAVSGLRATIGGAGGSVAEYAGDDDCRALRLTDTTTLDRVILGHTADAVAIGDGDFTCFVDFIYRSNSGAYGALGRWNTGASPATCEWNLGADNTFSSTTAGFTVAVGTTSYLCQSNATSWVVGRRYALFGARIGTTLNVHQYDHLTKLWTTGAVTNAGITTVNTAVSGRDTKLGEIDAGATYNLGADFIAAGTWKYGAPLAAIQAFVEEGIFSAYAAPASRLWDEVAAGGGGLTGPLIGGRLINNGPLIGGRLVHA